MLVAMLAAKVKYIALQVHRAGAIATSSTSHDSYASLRTASYLMRDSLACGTMKLELGSVMGIRGLVYSPRRTYSCDSPADPQWFGA